MRRSFSWARSLLPLLALPVAGCIWLLDTDELQKNDSTAAAGQPASAGSSQEGGQGGTGADAGAGGSLQAGAGGSVQPTACALSLECEDGDPCTVDSCSLDGQDCDQVGCVDAQGNGTGTCSRGPWTGEGLVAQSLPGTLTAAEVLGQPVITAADGAFLIAVHWREQDKEDVTLLRVGTDAVVQKVSLQKLLTDSGAGDWIPRSSPALKALPGGRALAIFGASQGDKSGLRAAILNAQTLAIVASEQISEDGYDAPPAEYVPQAFPLGGTQWLVQWVGTADGALRYAGVGVESNKLVPPSTINDSNTGKGVKSLAAVEGTGLAWGALLLHGTSVEAWHPSGTSAQLAGALDVAKPAGMSAARLGDGFALAAYADGTPQDGGKIFLRLLACTSSKCDVGTLQGSLGADQSTSGLYPALHAHALDPDPQLTQLVIANMLYPTFGGGLGYLGLFTVDRFKLVQDGQGYIASEAPQINPRYALFPGDLTQANVTTPRSRPAVHVASDGHIGLVWIEGATPTQGLRVAFYGTTQCPP